jgi:uncharacterized protein YbjT (DUF2867 family)
VLALPFGTGRTSPITASDVARAVAAVLVDPAQRIGQGLNRPIRGTDIAHKTWVEEILKPLGLPAHLQQHIETMALLHRAGRYDRATDDVERITGQPPSTVGRYIADNPKLFS